MIVVNGLLLLAQQEAALKPANVSGAGVWRQAATKVGSIVYPRGRSVYECLRTNVFVQCMSLDPG